MALAVNIVKRTVNGDLRVAIADITFDNSYVTGGMPLNSALLGLDQVSFMDVASASGYLIEYDYANKKLKARTSTSGAAAAEVANATNLSAVVARVMAYGI